MSDQTTTMRLSSSWKILKEASLEGFVAGCQGDYGELCFRVPDEYQRLGASSALPKAQRDVIAALPNERTIFQTGLAVAVAF